MVFLMRHPPVVLLSLIYNIFSLSLLSLSQDTLKTLKKNVLLKVFVLDESTCGFISTYSAWVSEIPESVS